MILMLITEQGSRKEAGEIFFIYYFCFKGSILIILVKRNFQNSFVLMERDSNTLSSKTQKISKKTFFFQFWHAVFDNLLHKKTRPKAELFDMVVQCTRQSGTCSTSLASFMQIGTRHSYKNRFSAYTILWVIDEYTILNNFG